jgi:hypothetical protein
MKKFSSHTLLLVFLTLGAVEGIISFAFLLAIPADPKNAWMFGYSQRRILIFVVNLIFLVLAAWACAKYWRDEVWREKLIAALDSAFKRRWLYTLFVILALMVAFAGIACAAFAITTTDMQIQAIFMRLAPMILWGALVSLQGAVIAGLMKYDFIGRAEVAPLADLLDRVVQNHYRNYAFIFLLLNSISIWLFFTRPELRGEFLYEDRLVENWSTGLFLAAFVVGLFLFLWIKNISKISLVVPILGLLGFLEEISFGERYFKLTMPIVAGVKLDSIHDLVDLIIAGETRSFLMENLIFLAVFGLLVLAVAVGLLVRSWEKVSLHFGSQPALIYAVLALFYVGLSQVLDLELFPSQWSRGIEEILELNAAVALVFGAFVMRRGIASE